MTTAETYTRSSASEAVTLEIVDLMSDRTILPSGHHVAYMGHHFLPEGVDSVTPGVVEFEVYTEAGVTPVRITIEAG